MKQLIIGLLVMLLIITGCASGKDISGGNKMNIPSVSVEQIEEVRSKLNSYQIKELSTSFVSEGNWFEEGGKMIIDGEKAMMTSNEEGISEAWYKHKESLSAHSDFIVSGLVTIPKSWDTHTKKDGQVGLGIFVGKKDDEGKLVYEADLCTVAGGDRFVQGQMIKNRLGGDPLEVDYKDVDTIIGRLEIVYQRENKTFTLLLDNEIIGSQYIDSNGAVDWQMADNDEFVVGIMGFSEWVKIESDYPSIESVVIYKE
jgi:hypothetical protein